MQTHGWAERLREWTLIVVGCGCFAASFVLFLEPHLIAPGGISGLGMVINYLVGLPLGMSILLLNAPLFVVAYLKFGLRFIARTLVATVLSSVLIDLGLAVIPPFTQELMLAALYGGVLLGAGMGMIFLGGATTGGSDILSKLVRLRWPQLRLGRAVLMVDAVIVAACAFVFRDVNLALYAAITLYTSSLVIDAILYGADRAVLCHIISDKAEEIGLAILRELQRGVTYLSGRGGHTGKERRVILCALGRGESAKLEELVRELDPEAFLIVGEARQVIGFGFRPKYKD